MKSNSIVSVLMTAYNRELFIAEAMESVLGSTLTNLELIVVDDCSTDKTVFIAKEYAQKDNRVKVFLNERNLGDYPNRNKAASYAKGKYLKYLDSDDVIYPYGLQMMVDAMKSFPEAGFGLAALPEPPRIYPVCITPREIFLEHFAGYKHFDRAPGSAIIRRDVFEKEGGFSGERMVGDLELWLRLARKYQMVKFPFDLYWNRLHKGQEYNSDYAKKIYPKRTSELITSSLNDPECPLNEEEKKKIFTSLKMESRKVKIKKGLRKLSGR